MYRSALWIGILVNPGITHVTKGSRFLSVRHYDEWKGAAGKERLSREREKQTTHPDVKWTVSESSTGMRWYLS